jgi:hypothetical protein
MELWIFLLLLVFFGLTIIALVYFFLKRQEDHELVKLQLENRHNAAKTFLSELAEQEKTFTKDIFEKYGKCNIDPETGEITPLD